MKALAKQMLESIIEECDKENDVQAIKWYVQQLLKVLNKQKDV